MRARRIEAPARQDDRRRGELSGAGRTLSRELVVLLVGTFVNRVGTCVGPFLALYLTNDRAMPLEQAGVIVSLVGLGSIASGPFGGALADRVGRRFTMGLACGLGALAMVILGLARTVPAIAGAALFLGFCGDMYRPAVSAIVADVVPPEGRAKVYGLLHWAVNLGFAAAMVIGGLVAAKSFAALFVLDAATTLAFGALVVGLVKETRPAHDATNGPRASLVTPYKDGLFVAFLVCSLVLSVAFFQGQVAFPAHLRAHGLGARAFGGLLAVNGALIVVIQPFAVSILGRMPRGRVLVGGALLTGFGWGMTELGGTSLAIYAAAIVVWTCGEIAMAPVTPAVIADMAPSDLRGTYQGAYQITFGGASFLAPVVGSVVMGRAGSAALWGACAVVGVLTAIGFAAIAPRAERRRASAPTARA